MDSGSGFLTMAAMMIGGKNGSETVKNAVRLRKDG
jgi:hypothetical protein